jgi:hypothetical protein
MYRTLICNFKQVLVLIAIMVSFDENLPFDYIYFCFWIIVVTVIFGAILGMLKVKGVIACNDLVFAHNKEANADMTIIE